MCEREVKRLKQEVESERLERKKRNVDMQKVGGGVS